MPAPTVDAAPPKPSGSDSGLSLAVLTHLGFGTPTGLAGMSVDFMPVRYVAIEVGAGTNLEGMEYEAGARARLPVLNNGRYFTIGAGWCEAMHYTADESANGILGFARIAESMGESSTSDTVWRHAQFFNTELGIETQEKHLLTRIYTGYAKLFNPATHTCSDAALPCKPDAGTGLVYVGVGFGYAF